jgi:hypothetical protein
MTKNKTKKGGIGSLLGYLDNQIELFRQKNNNYPFKIIMNKETRDKIFTELENDIDISLSWKDKKNNYRGIKIEISNIEQIKLE